VAANAGIEIERARISSFFLVGCVGVGGVRWMSCRYFERARIMSFVLEN
jgi:hypothetical protein